MTNTNEIKKLEIKETIQFAIKHVPHVDRTTLEQFWDLINATGSYGAMSYAKILTKMEQVLRYIPDACPRSLLTLADLLGVPTASFNRQLPANGQLVNGHVVDLNPEMFKSRIMERATR